LPDVAPQGPPRIVVVGASAGGLRSMERMLRRFPADFPCPILVVIHLDPHHVSTAAQLLQRSTALRVKEADEGELPRASTVYLARPDHHLEIRAGKIHLARSARVHFSRPSVDQLFVSAAVAYGPGTIGIVLSGSGTDGSNGLARIKAEGGVAIVEDAATAEHAAMPQAAAAAASIDAVLAPEDIPRFLNKAIASGTMMDKNWEHLLRLLKLRTRTDFSGYRVTTLRRRLDKRLRSTGSPDLASYVAYVKKHPAELDALHSSFLIKVSSFLRDSAAWTALDRNVVQKLVREAVDGKELRVWSMGCATGEEAYSIAMLFLDAIGDRQKVQLKVFATDVDDHALAVARAGAYLPAQAKIGSSGTWSRRPACGAPARRFGGTSSSAATTSCGTLRCPAWTS
jgi:two-component system CheB/CheR fusion protein